MTHLLSSIGWIHSYDIGNDNKHVIKLVSSALSNEGLWLTGWISECTSRGLDTGKDCH